MYRAPSVSSLALGLLLLAHGARAAESDDKRVCLSTYVKAQAARKDGELRASQEALVQCGRSMCPPLIRDDCVRWLREVTEATPTMVLSATGPDGGDLSDVRVTVDGQSLVTHLDGRPVAVDPGPHLFRFELGDGTAVDERVVVREAEHDRALTAVFPKAPPSARGADAVVATTRPTPAASWILGGVGVTSLLVSATFAGLAWFGRPGWISSQSCRPSCSRSDVDTVQQRFAVADVTGAVGLVSAGLAVYFFLARPERHVAPPLTLTLAPGAFVVGYSSAFF